MANWCILFTDPPVTQKLNEYFFFQQNVASSRVRPN